MALTCQVAPASWVMATPSSSFPYHVSASRWSTIRSVTLSTESAVIKALAAIDALRQKMLDEHLGTMILINIGFSLIMGFRVIENFNFPFVARNINEFWNRWHISLSSWCRAYVFTPVASATRLPYVAIVASMLVLALVTAAAALTAAAEGQGPDFADRLLPLMAGERDERGDHEPDHGFPSAADLAGSVDETVSLTYTDPSKSFPFFSPQPEKSNVTMSSRLMLYALNISDPNVAATSVP